MRNLVTRNKLPSRLRHRRSGSLYVAVMAVSLIVAMIGLSAIRVARAKLSSAQNNNDVYAAHMLALAAAETAISDINANSSWRSTYTNNVEFPSTPLSLNGGAMTWKVVDLDGDLNDVTTDSAILYGIGRVGDAVRVHRVDIEPSGSVMKINSSSRLDAAP